MIAESRLKGVYELRGKRTRLLTLNICPGKTVYDESLIRKDGKEYRDWNPRKSKLAAAILKGLSQMGIKEGYTVLYLGAASGTTVSHVSDIVRKNGLVFAVEFSLRPVRDLVFLAEERKNIAPIYGDGQNIVSLQQRISMVDCVYQDIAQKHQAEIFLNNCSHFLKDDGFGILCVKARSIDVTKKPSLVFKEVRRKLEEKMTIVDMRTLEPFEIDHCLFVVKK